MLCGFDGNGLEVVARINIFVDPASMNGPLMTLNRVDCFSNVVFISATLLTDDESHDECERTTH